MRIGFDIDGVVADMLTAITQCFSTDYYQIKREDIKHYDLEISLPWVKKKKIDDAINNPVFYYYMKPNNDAIDVINSAYDKGITVDLCTARDFNLCQTTTDWLTNHNVNYSRLIFIAPNDRKNYANDFGIKFFVEDNLETALSLEDVCNTYIVDAPYNRLNTVSKLLRIKNKDDWASLKKAILNYKE